MINVFLDNRDYFRYPMKQYPRIEYIRTMYKREINKVIEYYTNRSSRVQTEHVLSKLVYIISPDINNSIVDYFRLVDSRAKYVAKQFGITSNINVGHLNNDIFYKDSKELLLYSETDIDIFSFGENWKRFKPVRVIYTTDTDIDFKLLNGTVEKPDLEISVYEIDVIALVMMYRFWALERQAREQSIHPSYFIYNYVLPSMLKQLTDITIFNRFMNLYYGNYMIDNPYKHPFMLSDYTSGIDSVLKSVIQDTKNSRYDIRSIINRIPTIFNYNMLETLFINQPYTNRNSEWVIWVARLKYINFLLDLLDKNGMARNRTLYNDLSIYIRYIDNGSANILNRVDGYNREQIRSYIKKIKEICGKR